MGKAWTEERRKAFKETRARNKALKEKEKREKFEAKLSEVLLNKDNTYTPDELDQIAEAQNEKELEKILTKFNKGKWRSDIIPSDARAVDFRETCITHCSGEEFLIFYSSEIWGKNLCKKILEEHDDCVLMFEDEWSIQIKMPWEGIKYIKYPMKRTLTEEQRQNARNRLAEGRKKAEEKGK